MRAARIQMQQKLLLAFIMLALWASIILFIFYLSESELGNTFGVVVIFLLTRYFGLLSGIVVLLLRMLRIIKNKYSFIYIFVGLLNVGLGILSLVLFACKQMDSGFLPMFMFNLSIGLTIFVDILFLPIILYIIRNSRLNKSPNK